MTASSHDGIPEITVSLTSYPPRIDNVHRVVENMLAQTMKPDRIVLWLAEEQFPKGIEELPYRLKKLTDEGLEIRWCDDWKSYKKLVPSLREFPDNIIITVDDDLVYDERLIETLVDSYTAFPEAVSAVRTHLMRFNTDGSLCEYKDWRMDYQNIIGKPEMCLFATTGAGTLFPPYVFGPEATAPERFMELCPKADDVWVKVMQAYYRVPTVLAREIRPLKYIPDTQTTTLFEYNLRRGGNDTQLRAALDHYNAELENETLEHRLLLDSPGMCPEFAVIIPSCGDDAGFSRVMDSIKAQTRYGVCAVCVCGSDEEKERVGKYTSVDGRTITVEVPFDASLTERIAAGLQCTADGADHFMVLTCRDLLDPEALRQIYNQLVRTPCKMLAMTGAVTGTGCADDMTSALNFKDGDVIDSTTGGEIGSDLHTKVFHSSLRRVAAPLIGGARLDGLDAQRFAARVLMILSGDSAAAFPAYGMITRELFYDDFPVDEGYVIEMNRAGGQLAVQSPECRAWLVKMHESIFEAIERATDKSRYYAKLCEIFGEAVTASSLLRFYQGRECVPLETARDSFRKKAIPSVSPDKLMIIDIAGSEQIEIMLEACLNTVSSAVLLSADPKAAELESGRVCVKVLSYDEKSNIQSFVERLSDEIENYGPDAIQLIGNITPIMLGAFMLSSVAALPVMLCLEGEEENILPIWELSEYTRVIVTGNEEDAALLRLLDKRAAVCAPPEDPSEIDIDNMTDAELGVLNERLLTESVQKRVEEWREAYRMIEYIPQPQSKEQPLRRAIRRLTAGISENARKNGRLIYKLEKASSHSYASAHVMAENLNANIEDIRQRAEEKQQRMEKNSAEALDRQRRFSEGRINSLEKKNIKLDEERNRLIEEKKRLNEELKRLRESEKRAWREYNEVKESKIFLAGRVVTWLPRKAVLLGRRLLAKVRGRLK